MTILIVSKVKDKRTHSAHRYAAVIGRSNREILPYVKQIRLAGFEPIKEAETAPNGNTFYLWRIPAHRAAPLSILKAAYRRGKEATPGDKADNTKRRRALIEQAKRLDCSKTKNIKSYCIPERFNGEIRVELAQEDDRAKLLLKEVHGNGSDWLKEIAAKRGKGG